MHIITTIVLIKQQTKKIMNNLVKHIIMSLKNKESNKQYLIMLALYLIMFINEAYMHYEVYVTNYTPFACGMALYYWGMDVTIILLFFYSVTIGRRKLAFILSYCFINIFVLASTDFHTRLDTHIVRPILMIAVDQRSDPIFRKHTQASQQHHHTKQQRGQFFHWLFLAF